MIDLSLNALASPNRGVTKGATEDPNPLITMPTPPEKEKGEWKFYLTTKAMELLNISGGESILMHLQDGVIYLVNSPNLTGPQMKVYKNGSFSSKPIWMKLSEQMVISPGEKFLLEKVEDPHLENVAKLVRWVDEDNTPDDLTEEEPNVEPEQPTQSEEPVTSEEDPFS